MWYTFLSRVLVFTISRSLFWRSGLTAETSFLKAVMIDWTTSRRTFSSGSSARFSRHSTQNRKRENVNKNVFLLYGSRLGLFHQIMCSPLPLSWQTFFFLTLRPHSPRFAIFIIPYTCAPIFSFGTPQPYKTSFSFHSWTPNTHIFNAFRLTTLGTAGHLPTRSSTSSGWLTTSWVTAVTQILRTDTSISLNLK